MQKLPKNWLVVTAVTLVISVLIIAVKPPQFGIDFTGGTLLEISAPSDVENSTIKQAVIDTFDQEVVVQSSQDNSVIIRTTPLDETQHQQLLTVLTDQQLMEEELRFESIGPTIGESLREKAIIAIAVAILAMLLYLAYTFRQTSELLSSWKFGLAAVVALIHDVLVVTAIFSLLGPLGATVDTLFVTAMLAILGYSVNDTIVLFNRLKEEWLKSRTSSLEKITDTAIKKTLVRSLNTSFTTLLVLVALLIFGGETLRWFIAALAIGTISGTYSSLFVAPPVLQLLAKKK